MSRDQSTVNFLAGCVIIFVICLLPIGCIGGCVAYQAHNKYSDGYRVGTLQKFTQKGMFFKTYEGELATEGYKRVEAGGSVFEFSVRDNPEVVKKLQSAPVGASLRLTYDQYRSYNPLRQESSYTVNEVHFPGHTWNGETWVKD